MCLIEIVSMKDIVMVVGIGFGMLYCYYVYKSILCLVLVMDWVVIFIKIN